MKPRRQVKTESIKGEIVVKNYKLLITLVLLTEAALFSVPAQLIVLRHGEKVPQPKSQYAKLSKRGHQRARALAKLLAGETLPSFLLHKPDAILAITPRTLETIVPTAKAFGYPIQTYFGMTIQEISDQTKAAAHDLLHNPKYEGKVVIACWEHDNIPALATYLHARPVPQWKHDVFDRFWVLNFNCKNEPTVENIPQQLLCGDSTDDIKRVA
jgi:hypothetical protein